MRCERFQRTATGEVPLGVMRFFKPGQRCYIAAAGATADGIDITYGGQPIRSGIINIEESADVVSVPRDLVGTFVAQKADELIIELSGTVTGTQIDVWMLQPGESRPW